MSHFHTGPIRRRAVSFALAAGMLLSAAVRSSAEEPSRRPASDDPALDIVFMVDNSMSMKTHDPAGLRVDIIKALIEFYGATAHDGANDRFALIQYAEQPAAVKRLNMKILWQDLKWVRTPETLEDVKKTVADLYASPVSYSSDLSVAFADGMRPLLKSKNEAAAKLRAMSEKEFKTRLPDDLAALDDVWAILFTDGMTDIDDVEE